MTSEEILLIIKPIAIPDLKSEVEISINPSITAVDLVFQINDMYGTQGNFSFLFKGKKLLTNVSLKSQGIDKNNIKLLMSKSKEPLIPSEKKDSVQNNQIKNDDNLDPINQRIENARNKMINKYNSNSKAIELINSLLKTMPHKEEMSEEELIQRIEQFISTCLPKTIENYYLSLENDDDNSKIILDEGNLTSIFGQGNNTNGQLGIGNYISTDIPIRINNLKKLKINQIACGVGHVLALTDNNLIYSWGRFYKQENKKEKSAITGDYSSPQLIESLSNESIIKIAAGNNHSMAITELGELYTWGEGIYGQLGHGVNDNEQYPKKVKYFCNKFKIIDCMGGAAHTIVLTEDGYIFGWGQNDKNQLNLGKIDFINIPFLLLIYEFDNNLTIDEYKFLESQNIENNNENPNLNINLNELSTDIESLMKIEKIVCGTWYTAVTSKMFSSTIFIFGNKYKRVIKIDYFQKNNIEIKQIEASSKFLYVLSFNDKIYSINVDDLIFGKNIIEEIKNNEIKNINKFACGLDYLLILNESNQCFYMNNRNYSEIKLLNEDIKGDIYDISSGDSFFFIITKLSSIQFFENLYSSIKNYKNEDNGELLFNNSNSFDIILSPKSDSLLKYYCHSYIFELFIDVNKLTKDVNNKKNMNSYLIPTLKIDEILLLLEILYTSNIDWDNLNKDIENYIQLSNIITKILDFIKTYGKENKPILELISLYGDKISRYIKNFKSNDLILTQEDKTMEIEKMISKSFNTVVKGKNNIFSEIEKKKKEEEEKKKKKGSTINFSENENQNKERILNIEYYKKYQSEVDYIFSFYKKISELKKEINISKMDYIKNISNSKSDFPYSFVLKYKDSHYILNKDIISQKSKYFYNIINVMNLNQFDLDEIGLNFSDEIISYFINYLKGEKIEINLKDIIDLLDLAYFFMADNLFYLVNVQLERMINSENVLTLIEIAKDYNLKLMYNSCLIYITANIVEIREKGLLKFLKEDDRPNLRRIMELNNIK